MARRAFGLSWHGEGVVSEQVEKVPAEFETNRIS